MSAQENETETGVTDADISTRHDPKWLGPFPLTWPEVPWADAPLTVSATVAPPLTTK